MNPQQPAQAQVRPKGLAPIWLLPFIALLIVSWLVWRTLNQAGIDVQVRFENGRGIKAGKTEILHKGITVGKVTSLSPSEDLEAVNVDIEMNRRFEHLLTKSSAFWLVKPQVSFAGVSGLDTLVSGNYIAFRPGNKADSKEKYFKALPEPPPGAEQLVGLNLVLRAKELSSVEEGSPVYYRKLKVGEVSGYELADDGDYVNIKVYIKHQFARLIHQNTRFWNASGVHVSGSLTNLKVQTESLVSIVQGGISFYTPDWEDAKPNVQNGEEFILFSDYDEAEVGIPITIEFPLEVSLGESNMPLRFHGFEIGRIKNVDLSDDLSRIIAEATVRPEVKPALVEGARFWVVEPRLDLQGVSGLETLLGGRYIAMEVNKTDVDKGISASFFKGVAQRPAAPPSTPGLHLTLYADALSGINVGSPVLYRNVPVGSVQAYELKTSGIEIQALVKPMYRHLINESSRFWNVSGISLEGNLNGFKIQAGTLNSFISGGIAFSTEQPDAAPVAKQASFMLYPSNKASLETSITIDIRFETADGLRIGTKLKYRGMEVGRIESLELDKKGLGVIAHCTIDEEQSWLARTSSRFWLVRPQLGLAGTAHLETLVTGQYINIQTFEPVGPETRSFIGSIKEPENQPKISGLELELVSDRLGSIRHGNPVYYREIPVGQVTGYKLDNPASQVIIYVNIEEQYKKLVSERSEFWNASGINIDVSLFKGAKIRTESLEALLAGGIAFATPDAPEQPVTQGKRYWLHEKVENSWLKWAPEITLE